MWPPGATDTLCPRPCAITQLHWSWQSIAHAPSAYQVWSWQAFLFGRYDRLSVSALIGIVTLTIWPWNRCAFAPGVGNIHANFGVFRTFPSRLTGQHLSDGPCDLATLTFDLGGHGACRLYRSLCSICIPSLKLAVSTPSNLADITQFLSKY